MEIPNAGDLVVQLMQIIILSSGDGLTLTLTLRLTEIPHSGS